eukprot:TRINITY_DN92040_c0_g1_i1.p1 TRINITY_DN92040_c0_g1~~TRINITY_DN92040_c0_g1_i1.p1  ORF type:complete len:312 (-),score=45.98 TRINITY_DN92040_c0_g1_i1:61-996(-)
MQSAAGADAGAGTPGAPLGTPAPPMEAGSPVTAPVPASLPALREEQEGLDTDGQHDEADIQQYGQTLGVDMEQHGDLLWAVQEAFNAPLPLSWTEHTDDEGRVYFYNESSGQSTWEHPMDSVYRELLSIVQRAREADMAASEEACAAVVQSHLRDVHQRALQGLEDWSGPYASEEGEYYYNHRLKTSTWECPLSEWEEELRTRHSLLCRCLLGAGRMVSADGSVIGTARSDGSSSSGPDLLAALRLPLNLVRRDTSGEQQPETPSTSRSFHTARSMHSTRSQRSQNQKLTQEEAERRAASPQAVSARDSTS